MTPEGLEILAVKPLSATDSPLLHQCAEGHVWTEQPDGTVSPSWGLGGTHAAFPGHDPRTCPEPERDVAGRYRCPGCGGRFHSGHGPAGVMCDPWNHREGCVAPPPACGLPAVESSRWMAVKAELRRERGGVRPGWTRTWVPLGPDGSPRLATVREPTLF
jgi:hypothetical protein